MFIIGVSVFGTSILELFVGGDDFAGAPLMQQKSISSFERVRKKLPDGPEIKRYKKYEFF